MKGLQEIIKHVSLLSQLGLSFITPIVLCVLGCWFLCEKCGFGAWIYIIGFVFGLGGAFMTAYKFYCWQTRKKEDRKPPVSFNRHS